VVVVEEEEFKTEEKQLRVRRSQERSKDREMEYPNLPLITLAPSPQGEFIAKVRTCSSWPLPNAYLTDCLTDVAFFLSSDLH
jgi:hypothetical protein